MNLRFEVVAMLMFSLVISPEMAGLDMKPCREDMRLGEDGEVLLALLPTDYEGGCWDPVR